MYLRERESMHAWEEREGPREREKQTSHWIGSPMQGPIPGPRDHDSQDQGIMTWAKGRRPTDWATQAPPLLQFFFFFLRFYLFIRDTERKRKRKREAETQAEVEAGSRTMPKPKAGTKPPLSHPRIPLLQFLKFWSSVTITNAKNTAVHYYFCLNQSIIF